MVCLQVHKPLRSVLSGQFGGKRLAHTCLPHNLLMTGSKYDVHIHSRLQVNTRADRLRERVDNFDDQLAQALLPET